MCSCRDETSCRSWSVIGNSAGSSVGRGLRGFAVAQEGEVPPKEVIKYPLAALRSNTVFFSNIRKCYRLYTDLQVSPISDSGVCVCFHTDLATPPLERSTRRSSQDRAAPPFPGPCWSASPSLWRLRLLKSASRRLSSSWGKYYPVDRPQRWEPQPVCLHDQVRKRWSSD